MMKNFILKNKNLLLYFVTLSLLLINLAIDIFLLQFGSVPVFNLGFKIPAFIISVGAAAGFVFYLCKKGTLKINRWQYLIFGFLALTILIGTLCSKNSINFTLTGYDGNKFSFLYETNATNKTIFALDSIAFVTLAFLIIFVTPSVIDFNGNIIYLMYIFLGIVGIAIIYSLITESNKLGNFFSNITDPNHTNTLTSFLFHRNVFGLVLMISVMVVVYIFFRFNKKRILFGLIPLLLFLLFTMCKTALILTTVFLITSALTYAAKLYKQSKKASFTVLGIIGGILVLGIIVIFATPLRDKFYSIFVDTGKLTIGTRATMWQKTLEITAENPVSLIFGRGFGQFSSILYKANISDLSCPINFNCYNAHNLYLQEFGNGGIVFEIALIALIVYLAYMIIKNIKTNKRAIDWLWLYVLVIFMVQCVFETIL